MSKNKLTISGSFLLLTHHPDRATYLVSDRLKNMGIIGGMLLDLIISGNIEVVDGRIDVLSDKTNLSQIHQDMLDKISGISKIKKVSTWLSRLSTFARKYNSEVTNNLVGKGALEYEDKNIFFIKYKRPKIINKDIRESIISNLKDVILNNNNINEFNLSILSLIHGCGLYNIVGLNRDEIKEYKVKIKEIMNSDEYSRNVSRRILLQIQAITYNIINIRPGL